jgi:hypothetical protein
LLFEAIFILWEEGKAVNALINLTYLNASAIFSAEVDVQLYLYDINSYFSLHTTES